MRKTVKQIAILSVTVGLVCLSISAYAFPPEGGFRGRGEWRGRHMTEEEWKRHKEEMHARINLTPEQEDQMEIYRKAHREKMNELHQALKAKLEALREEVGKTEPDMVKVNALKDDMKSIEAQKVDLRVRAILEVREILTPEQFEKFQEFGRRHREKRQPCASESSVGGGK